MDIIFENPEIRISFDPGSGDSDEVILAFTGGRHALAGIDKDDFVKTNRSSRIVRDAYYINDLRRSWYNGIRQAIVDELAPRVGGRRVVTLGNSLGGFGALMFAGLFETCDVAIAFAPQYSVKPELVPFEDRWEHFYGNIEFFESDTCFVTGVDYSRCRKYIFCGQTENHDRRHADLIAQMADANTHIFAIADCGHDVSFKLKENGVLGELIETAIGEAQGAEQIHSLLTARGVSYTTLGVS